jgi:putative ABC transport system substrate-binding protein
VDRRVFVAGTLALLAAPLGAQAQSAGGVYRIGLLTLGSDPTRSGFWQKFLQAMRELNYVEGHNLEVKRAFADGRTDRLPGLVNDLMRAHVDVIVTTSTPETLAGKRATSTIPIVMTVAPDPVEQGLVMSLARPGGNVTGLTSMAPGTHQKLVELLRETVPSAAQFAIVSGLNAPPPEIRRELRAAGQQVGISLSFIRSAPESVAKAVFMRPDGDGGSRWPAGP